MTQPVYLVRPKATLAKRRRVVYCPRCKRRRLCDILTYEWYSPLAKCRTCGRTIVRED